MAEERTLEEREEALREFAMSSLAHWDPGDGLELLYAAFHGSRPHTQFVVVVGSTRLEEAAAGFVYDLWPWHDGGRWLDFGRLVTVEEDVLQFAHGMMREHCTVWDRKLPDDLPARPGAVGQLPDWVVLRPAD